MTDEELRLLREFDSPQVVNRACQLVHRQDMFFAVPQQIIQAEKDGLLRIDDFDGPLKDSKGLYSRCLVLTDAGRVAVGLPPVVAEQVKVKKRERPSLFD